MGNSAHAVLDPKGGRTVPPDLCALGIMTKAPRAGQVKTRLTPPLTPDEAAALNICFLRDTTAAITGAVQGDRARGIGVYTPVGEEHVFAEILPLHFQLVAQRGEAFGARLAHAFEDLFALGFASVCLINSDSPSVPATAYRQAVNLLAQPGDRVVLGPSDDGGYYLIGLKQLHQRLFQDIAWSTERVYQQTVARAEEIGLTVEKLPTYFDIDDRAGLRRLCGDLLDSKKPGSGAIATREFLTAIIAREGRARIWPENL